MCFQPSIYKFNTSDWGKQYFDEWELFAKDDIFEKKPKNWMMKWEFIKLRTKKVPLASEHQQRGTGMDHYHEVWDTLKMYSQIWRKDTFVTECKFKKVMVFMKENSPSHALNYPIVSFAGKGVWDSWKLRLNSYQNLKASLKHVRENQTQ